LITAPSTPRSVAEAVLDGVVARAGVHGQALDLGGVELLGEQELAGVAIGDAHAHVVAGARQHDAIVARGAAGAHLPIGAEHNRRTTEALGHAGQVEVLLQRSLLGRGRGRARVDRREQLAQIGALGLAELAALGHVVAQALRATRAGELHAALPRRVQRGREPGRGLAAGLGQRGERALTEDTIVGPRIHAHRLELALQVRDERVGGGVAVLLEIGAKGGGADGRHAAGLRRGRASRIDDLGAPSCPAHCPIHPTALSLGPTEAVPPSTPTTGAVRAPRARRSQPPRPAQPPRPVRVARLHRA
jgi:hypothetical protein